MRKQTINRTSKMSTLKDLALGGKKIVSEDALNKTLTELKTYINEQAAVPAQQVQAKLDTLIGAQNGDVDKLLNTFNDIKAFLSDYDEDDTLKSLLDAVGTAISTEQIRAQGAESALSGRITTLENVSVMTTQEAATLFDSIFNPVEEEEEEEQQGGGE